MSSLVAFEQHASFAEASIRAKAIARRFHRQTGVSRSTSCWAVLCDHMVCEGLQNEEQPLEGDDSAFAEEHKREVIEPLFQEQSSDQDAWARSEEDGWFYED